MWRLDLHVKFRVFESFVLSGRQISDIKFAISLKCLGLVGEVPQYSLRRLSVSFQLLNTWIS